MEAHCIGLNFAEVKCVRTSAYNLSTNIMFLDIIHRPVFAKNTVQFLSTELAPISGHLYQHQTGPN
jgi:hypothetical protein